MFNGNWQAEGVIRVLVVNDESAIRNLLQQTLSEEGYTAIETAKDGQQALAALRQSRIHRVMILDDIMPVMGGREVVEALVADPELAHRTACVYLTARPSSLPLALTQLLMRVNATVLNYGFDPASLLRAVEEAAGRLAG